MDYNIEAHIHTGGRPITSLRGMEKDHHGIVDLSFGFDDGTYTPWALQGALPPNDEGVGTAPKVWEHSVPRGAWATGIRVRTQPHFGIIDVILQVCESPDRLVPSPSEPVCCWELVDGTQAPEEAT